MDNAHRTKIKIGPHELDTEGSPEFVQEQVRLFKEMVASTALPPLPYPQNNPPAAPKQRTIAETSPDTIETELYKIMRFDEEERIVSLTVRPPSVEDAILLILLGQRAMLNHESVTGGAIMEGITATGGLQVTRVDRLLEKLGKDGDVIVVGRRRSKTYRLTNSGVNRAREAASAALFLLP
jgi:hypothetical protein